MHSRRETLRCRYLYDPLDRLVESIPAEQANTQRFYLKDRLATEIQGAIKRSILQHEDQLLAQQQREGVTVKTNLLATDQQRSVLNALDTSRPRFFAYTPYGHRSREGGLLSLLGFNGERPDPLTGHYHLGKGYRQFNPVLMRFNSPDSWSPFGRGGLNAYVYCVGDPINRRDPTGHTPVWLKTALRSLGLMSSRTSDASSVMSNISVTSRRSALSSAFHNSRAYSRNSPSSVDDLFSSPLSEKTPAWTYQDRLPFAGTEARHPGAPSFGSSNSSPVSSGQNSPVMQRAPIETQNGLLPEQPASFDMVTRSRRGAVLYNQNEQAIEDFRARFGGSFASQDQTSPLNDPSPTYDLFAPPSYNSTISHLPHLIRRAD